MIIENLFGGMLIESMFHFLIVHLVYSVFWPIGYAIIGGFALLYFRLLCVTVIEKNGPSALTLLGIAIAFCVWYTLLGPTRV